MPGNLLLATPSCLPTSVLCSYTFECPTAYGGGTQIRSNVVSDNFASHSPCYYTSGDGSTAFICTSGGPSHPFRVRLIFDVKNCRWRCSIEELTSTIPRPVYVSGYLYGKDPRGTYPDGSVYGDGGQVHDVTVT